MTNVNPLNQKDLKALRLKILSEEIRLSSELERLVNMKNVIPEHYKLFDDIEECFEKLIAVKDKLEYFDKIFPHNGKGDLLSNL